MPPPRLAVRKCVAEPRMVRKRRAVAAIVPLKPRQRRHLQDQGYLVVRSLLDPAVLTPISNRLKELVRQTVAAWADEPSLDTNAGCVMAEFDVADPGFAPCCRPPCSPTRRPRCSAMPGTCQA